MPYIGNQHNVGDHVNNFKVLDDISSYTATFDGSATSVISTANNTIRIPLHRFIQGQRITYNNGGGSNIGGLTSGTAYYISFDSANTIKLATSLSNANSNTTINLSSVGGGTSHTLNAAFDGINTKFKVTYASGKSARFNNATQLNVAINNVIQRPNLSATSFTEGFAIEDNHKIVFKDAPTVNDIFWGSIIANTIENFDLRDNEVDNFTGDGSTIEFTLSTIPANNESVVVSIDGVLQHPSDSTTARAYTLIDSIIQFTAAPALNAEIQVRHIGFAGASTNDVSGFYGRTGNVALTANDHITTGDLTSRNVNVSGILTASSASFGGNVSIGGTLTYEDVTNIDSVGIITARSDILFPTSMDSTESGGVAVQRFWSTGTITAGSAYKCGKWEEGEGSVQLSINVRSETASHSGTATYLWQGGYLPIGGTGYSRLFPLSSGNGHGDGTDNGLNTGGWGVIVRQSGSYGFEIWVYVPSGKANKALKVTVTELNRGNTFTDLSASASMPSLNASYQNSIKNTSIEKLYFKDNKYAYFGDSQDLQLFHDGSSSRINASNGALVIQAVTQHDIVLSHAGEDCVRCKPDGAVELSHDGVEKIRTTSSGISVTGNVVADGADINGDLDVDGHTNLDNVSIAGVTTGTIFKVPDATNVNGATNHIAIGDNSDLKLYHDNNGDTQIFNSTGHLTIVNNTSGKIINLQPKSGANGIIARYEGAAELYYNGTKRLETTSAGVVINGAAWLENNGSNLEANGLGINASIFHNGDTDTAMDFAGSNDQINFRTAATVRATIQNTGLSVIGIMSASNANISGDIDVDGHTNLDNVSVAGVTTFTGHIDASGDVYIADKIIHAGDTNTAIRFPSNDTISFETAGSERVRIDGTGKVGITSTAPTGALDIKTGTHAFDGFIKLTKDADFNPSIEYYRTTGSGPTWYGAQLRLMTGDFTYSYAGSSTLGNHSYSEILRITQHGKVGISTSIANAKLEIGTVTGGTMNATGIQVNRPHSLGLQNGVHVYNDGGYNGNATYQAAAFKATGANGYAFVASTSAGSDGLGGNVNASINHEGFAYFSRSSGDTLKLESTDANGRTTLKFNTNGNDWEMGARGSSGNPNNGFYIYDMASSSYRMIISTHGGTVINKGGTVHNDSGYAGLEVKAISSEHQLVLSSASNASNSNYARLGFKLHPSNQNERIKAAIVCQGSGGGYGEVSRMMFCIDDVADNGNADGNSSDEKARIDSSGNMMVGATSALGQITSQSNGTKFQYASHNTDTSSSSQLSFRFMRNSADVGSVTTTPSATAYNTSSDYRLKENQVAISDGIARLKNLKPYRFNFKVDPDKTVDGFFAHEVTPIIPEAVTGEKDAEDMQQLDYAKLTPLLTAALQEAITKIETLETKVAALEGS